MKGLKKYLNHSRDTQIERDRYDQTSMRILEDESLDPPQGYIDFPPEHIPPFYSYYTIIQKFLQSSANIKILEIGAGTGQHTRQLIASNTHVTVLDISEKSLAIIKNKFNDKVITTLGNMEELPFEDSSFDLIVSCGSLSYGDPTKVDKEIVRVLKPRGSFIFIDTLNHNLLYKMNRWIRVIRGTRSLSTVVRIPTLARISELRDSFESSSILFFGAWIWVHQITKYIFGKKRSLKVFNLLESKFGNGRYSFKVVAELKGKRLDLSI